MQYLNQFNTTKFNIRTNSTLEQIQPLNKFNPWKNSTLEPIQLLKTLRPVEPVEPLKQLNLYNDCNISQLIIWTKWTLAIIESLE